MQGDEVASRWCTATPPSPPTPARFPCGQASDRLPSREAIPAHRSTSTAARSDAFDRWSDEQRGSNLGQTSVQYLPQDLRTYAGTFDRYGSWSYDTTYGNVWYPSASDNWRPYTDGYWGSYPVYGSVWVGSGPWSWPTHHYGRWGISLSGRWFWIPGRVWGPAWVYWAVNQDYVGLVPAWLERLPGVRHVGCEGRLQLRPLRPMAGVDSRAEEPLRPQCLDVTRGDRRTRTGSIACVARSWRSAHRRASTRFRARPSLRARTTEAPGCLVPGRPASPGWRVDRQTGSVRTTAGQPQAGRAEFRRRTLAWTVRASRARPIRSGTGRAAPRSPYSRRAVPGAPAGSARDPRSMNTPRPRLCAVGDTRSPCTATVRHRTSGWHRARASTIGRSDLPRLASTGRIPRRVPLPVSVDEPPMPPQSGPAPAIGSSAPRPDTRPQRSHRPPLARLPSGVAESRCARYPRRRAAPSSPYSAPGTRSARAPSSQSRPAPSPAPRSPARGRGSSRRPSPLRATIRGQARRAARRGLASAPPRGPWWLSD